MSSTHAARGFRARGPWVYLSLTVLVAVFGVLPPAGACGDLPATIRATWPYLSENPYPTWVSLDAAFTSDGDLNPDLFHPQLAADLERMLVELHNPALGCSHFGSRFIAGPKYARGTSLKSVSRGSAAVISGSVDGRDYGFDRGWPGQLLRIRISKRYSGRVNEDVVYAFIPVARFTLPDGRVVCAEAPGYADPPQIGDSVVLFVPEHESGDFLDLQGPNSIVVLRATGQVALPAEISQDGDAAVAAKKGVPAFLDELARQLALPASAEGVQ